MYNYGLRYKYLKCKKTSYCVPYITIVTSYVGAKITQNMNKLKFTRHFIFSSYKLPTPLIINQVFFPQIQGIMDFQAVNELSLPLDLSTYRSYNVNMVLFVIVSYLLSLGEKHTKHENILPYYVQTT